MAHIRVKTERIVNASPESVYAVLSDYVNKRPQILTPNFMDYAVEKGGQGKGTVVSYRLHAANREREYRLRIEEPVKGRVITEQDASSSLVNTWTITPTNDDNRTFVSIVNEWDGGSGMKGFFEKTFAPLGLKNIYGKILDSLDRLVSNVPAGNVNKSVQERGGGLGDRIGLLLLVLSSVVGIAFVIGYRQRNHA
jgi:Polyketide cyclase / dehydrase and lipid transport